MNCAGYLHWGKCSSGWPILLACWRQLTHINCRQLALVPRCSVLYLMPDLTELQIHHLCKRYFLIVKTLCRNMVFFKVISFHLQNSKRLVSLLFIFPAPWRWTPLLANTDWPLSNNCFLCRHSLILPAALLFSTCCCSRVVTRLYQSVS